MRMKHKSYPAEFKLKEYDPNKLGSEFSGYATVFNEPDLEKDINQKGCFAESIKVRLKEKGSGLKCFNQHNKHEPIGHIKEVSEDSTGLMIDKGWIDHTSIGKDVALMMSSGTMGHMSIGYYEQDVDTKTKSGYRILRKGDIFDVSPVVYPAQPLAAIHTIKTGMKSLFTEEKLKSLYSLSSLLGRTPTALDILINPDEWREEATTLLARAASEFAQLALDIQTMLECVPEAEMSGAIDSASEMDTSAAMEMQDCLIENLMTDGLTEEEITSLSDAVARLDEIIGDYPQRLVNQYYY